MWVVSVRVFVLVFHCSFSSVLPSIWNSLSSFSVVLHCVFVAFVVVPVDCNSLLLFITSLISCFSSVCHFCVCVMEFFYGWQVLIEWFIWLICRDTNVQWPLQGSTQFSTDLMIDHQDVTPLSVVYIYICIFYVLFNWRCPYNWMSI